MVKMALSNQPNQSLANEEDSFVILGSSPTPSMLLYEANGALSGPDGNSVASDTIRNNLEEAASQLATSTYVDALSGNSLVNSVRQLNMSLPTQNALQSNTFSSASVFSNDLSPEEIQQKLNLLLQENLQLKENLQQNNIAMRQQFNTLMVWQEDVRTTHQTHKKKFNETKELITRLRTENAELKRNLSQNDSGSDSLSTRNEYLKLQNEQLPKKLSEAQIKREPLQKSSHIVDENADLVMLKNKIDLLERNKLELDIERDRLKVQLEASDVHCSILRKEKTQRELDIQKLRCENINIIKEIETAAAECKQTALSRYKTDIGELESKCRRSDMLIVDLNAELQLCREEIRSAHQIIADYEKNKNSYEMINVPPSSIAPSDVNPLVQSSHVSTVSSAPMFTVASASIDTISRLRDELQHLKAQLLEAQEQKVTLMVQPLSAQSASITENDSDYSQRVRLYNDQLCRIVDCYNRHSKRQALLSHVLEGALLAIPVNESAHRELISVNDLLIAHQAELVHEREEMLAAQQEFEKIYGDYVLLKQELQDVRDSNLNSNTANANMLKEQERSHNVKIDTFHAQLLQKDEQIAQTNTKLRIAMEELATAQQKNETVDILQAQLEVYKTDFEQERSARQALAGEKEQLAVDLRLLQRRNQQLIEEVQGTGAVGGTTATAPDFEHISIPASASYSCPSEQDQSQPSDGDRTAQYSCPMCFAQFRSLHLVQSHVEYCGESPT